MFIVLEGIDGSGKTTQINKLHENLSNLGHRVHVTSEPSCLGFAADAREEMGKDNPDLIKVALLFTLDRMEHQKLIQGWLDEGCIVLCDRYYPSSMVYQSSTKGLSMRSIWEMNLNCIQPDIFVWLNLSPELAIKRVVSRDVRDPWETLDNLKLWHKRYKDWAHNMETYRTSPDKCWIKYVHASMKTEMLSSVIFDAVTKRMENK